MMRDLHQVVFAASKKRLMGLRCSLNVSCLGVDTGSEIRLFLNI